MYLGSNPVWNAEWPTPALHQAPPCSRMGLIIKIGDPLGSVNKWECHMKHETCKNTLFKHLPSSFQAWPCEAGEFRGDMIKGTCVNRNSLECAVP